MQRQINHTIEPQTDVPEVLNESASFYEECDYSQGDDEENGAKGLDIDYEYFPNNNDDYYDELY